MKNKIKHISLALAVFACITGCSIHSSENPLLSALEKVNISSQSPKTFLLPVNATLPQGERVNVAIQRPQAFKCLQGDPTSSMPSTLEFIPETDTDPYKWSEIITINCFPGKGIQSKYITQFMKQNIKGKVLEENSKNFKAYSTSSIAISYTANDRRELLYAKYFSGPNDCAGFQCSIALTDQMTESQALDKIKEFEKTQVAVFEF